MEVVEAEFLVLRKCTNQQRNTYHSMSYSDARALHEGLADR